MDIGNNQFTGEIPESLYDLTSLNFLSLSNNNLEGNINSDISSLSSVYFLDLSFNNFMGEIPTELNDLDLYLLKLNNNQFTGTIPPEFCDIDVLDLSYNKFCLPYPECLSEETIGYQNNSECVECSVVLSDLNNDLSLNVMDVILMVGCVLSESCDECSDFNEDGSTCLLYTSPSPRDLSTSRMPSSA